MKVRPSVPVWGWRRRPGSEDDSHSMNLVRIAFDKSGAPGRNQWSDLCA